MYSKLILFTATLGFASGSAVRLENNNQETADLPGVAAEDTDIISLNQGDPDKKVVTKKVVKRHVISEPRVVRHVHRVVHRVGKSRHVDYAKVVKPAVKRVKEKLTVSRDPPRRKIVEKVKVSKGRVAKYGVRGGRKGIRKVRKGGKRRRCGKRCQRRRRAARKAAREAVRKAQKRAARRGSRRGRGRRAPRRHRKGRRVGGLSPPTHIDMSNAEHKMMYDKVKGF